MTATYTEFIDSMGSDFNRVPLVAGGYRATYNTGEAPVPASQAQIDAARAAGMTVLLYDQWPGLAKFAAGESQMADVETDAGTTADVDAAIIARRTKGLAVHTVYCSYSRLAEVKGSIANPAGVFFGVADYSWNLTKSQNLLAANPDWGYIQFGDPASNPLTLAPGTSVDLAYANADINVASDAWLALVTSAPAPSQPAPAPAPPAAPAWPFGPFDYLSKPSSDPHCHSGFYSSVDNHVVRMWQQRMKDRGWTIEVDGEFWDQSLAVCEAFQAEKGLQRDGKVGPITWRTAWTAPITA